MERRSENDLFGGDTAGRRRVDHGRNFVVAVDDVDSRSDLASRHSKKDYSAHAPKLDGKAARRNQSGTVRVGGILSLFFSLGRLC